MNKKILLGLFFGIFLIICSYSVMATNPTPSLISPVVNGNYSGTLTFTCYVDANGVGTAEANATVFTSETNATLWASDGATNVSVSLLSNDSAVNQTSFTTSSADISLLDSLRTYSFVCEITNKTHSYNSSAITPIRIDNIIPILVTIDLPANNDLNYSDTYSGLVRLNVTVNDDLDGVYNISSVYFNITNSAGTQWNISAATNVAGKVWWNATINTSIIPDGIYNITAYVTDISGNINSTRVRSSIIFDNSGPAISAFSCSPASVNVGRATACTCTATDLTPFTYNSYGTSPAVSSIGTHTLTCTTTDQFGLETSTTTTYTVTSGSSTISGGTGTTTTWTNTLAVTTSQLEQGYTQELKAQERMKVTVAGGIHHVGVKSVTATSATIEIASDPVSIVLDIGEDAKVDVDNDGTYDLYVKLNAIANSKADVTVKKLSEAVPAGEGPVSTSGEIETTTPSDTGKTTGMSKTWIYVIVVVVILVIVGIAMAKRKK